MTVATSGAVLERPLRVHLRAPAIAMTASPSTTVPLLVDEDGSGRRRRRGRCRRARRGAGRAPGGAAGCSAPQSRLMFSPSGVDAERDHRGAELLEHLGADLVGGAVRAVDDDRAGRRAVRSRGKRVLHEHDVAADARRRCGTPCRSRTPSGGRGRSRRAAPGPRSPPRRRRAA